MKDRGMKKWLAYKSLVEQYTSLDDMFNNRHKVDKPLISSDKANEINNILVNYHGEELEIIYYDDGYIKNSKSTIRKIDSYHRRLYLSNEEIIAFSQIIDIVEEICFF